MGNTCCTVKDKAEISFSLHSEDNNKKVVRVKAEAGTNYPTQEFAVIVDRMNEPSELARPKWEKYGFYKARDDFETEDFERCEKVHRYIPTNETYIGQYLEGKRWGLGTEITTIGSVYSGNYINDQKQGTGRLIYTTGDVYEGDFKDGLPHGNGTVYFANDFVYEGEFKNGKRDGHGKETSPDGTLHEGLYKEGFKDGHGIWEFPDGSRYEGSFKHDNCHGFGTFTYPENSKSVKYEGYYAEEGLKHGHGKLWMSNGYVYEGDFQLDKMTGHGVITTPEEGTFEGIFFDGKRNGVVKHVKANGDVSVAEYSHDKKIKDLPDDYQGEKAGATRANN